MDATGDEDLKLQRASADLIAELQRLLPHFLYKSKLTKSGQSSAATGAVRRLVPQTKTDQLIKLLEPFQEWPQLLDPHLTGLLQPLISAFMEYLSNHATTYYQEGAPRPGIIPLPRGICKILYVFCKVRGAKVITQFLNNEPKSLEPMLEALESWSGKACSNQEESAPKYGYMVWEENFIMLLWLSHLLLAPFDLSSMSSDNAGTQLRDPPLYVGLPETIPPIAKRLVRMSTYHITLPSKAREAAGTVLVRLAVRTDMRRIGLQNILIDWALSTIRTDPDAEAPTSIYGLMGILSFLSGFIVSVETEILAPLLSNIYESIQQAQSDKSTWPAEAISSVSTRKLVIKIERALAVAGMKIDSKAPDDSNPSLGEGALEDIIEHLIEALEYKDTPVRLAASKSLSVIALQLEPDMVEQIIDMIDERLYEDTMWKEANSRADIPGSFELDLGAVSASRWHGLILALSQLIFRGSMPPTSVFGKVISSLTIALRFEQRSLGNSIGTSVRDAACFGLWALTRRFSTAAVKNCVPFRHGYQDRTPNHLILLNESEYADATSSIFSEEIRSTLQILANELVLTATLDPAGNIRRGASAALQEMIGRHPEEIKHGIDLVQIVDYHAIALRSRAMTSIAIKVSQMEPAYWHSILRGLLDWRGVCSRDVDCRRNAAHAIGLLSHSRGSEMVASTISILRRRLQVCEIGRVEERHGLILALSEILTQLSNLRPSERSHILGTPGDGLAELWRIPVSSGSSKTVSKKGLVATDGQYLHSALTCEAICSLVAALASCSVDELPLQPSSAELQKCLEAVEISLRQSDEMVHAATARASRNLFRILDRAIQDEIVSRWTGILNDPSPRSREGSVMGVAAALGAVYKYVGASQSQELTIDSLVSAVGSENGIGLRCTALRSLTSGVLGLNVISENVSQALHTSLNDYTTDRRGDVGSLIRLEAIDATAVVLEKGLLSMRERQNMAARVCGLAVEKLDKVRFRAWNCLRDNWSIFGLGAEPQTLISDISQTSTIGYFLQLLYLCSQHSTQEWIRKPLLEGYVTSAGAGSESLLEASRAAFISYTESLDLATLALSCRYLIELLRENISNDRVAVPTLEFIAFLLETGILQRLRDQSFAWKRLFTEVRKAHFKSSNVQKIEAAVRIYAGMMAVPSVRAEVQEKLGSMLLHPYPKIRNAAADALFIVTEDESLMGVNWSKPTEELKAVVRSFRFRVGVQADVT